MKNIVFISAIFFSLSFLNYSCSSEEQSNNKKDDIVQQDSVAVDTLKQIMDSISDISKSGALFHYEEYKIGNIKSVSCCVAKITNAEGFSRKYIQFRKDCGNAYYYMWEYAILLEEELPSLYTAVDTIIKNLDRVTDHNERYAYTTIDDITIRANAENNKAWELSFSVDYHKDNSTINLRRTELDELMTLIKKAERKLSEI